MPGLAVLALLIPAIGFLWPGMGPQRIVLQAESWSIRPRSAAALAAIVATLVPLAVVLLEHPATTFRFGRLLPAHTDAPISRALTPTITTDGATVRVSWQPTSRPGGTKIAYAVFRTTGGDGCSLPPAGSRQCLITSPVLASTTQTTFIDKPGHGRFWYRIAAVADYRDSPGSTDLMLLGPAVSVRA